ncbi:MAG: glycosyltransferase [Planctomycetota bacterium]
MSDPVCPQRVAVLSTYATHGGAARSALRHHLALREAGVESTMLTLQADVPEELAPHVLGIDDEASTPERDLARKLLHSVAIERNRSSLATTWFSWPLYGVDLAQHPAVVEADAISVHWVSGLLSMSQLEGLFTLGKPVVFMHHDEWLFTGGCHYTASADGSPGEFSGTSQLAEDPFGVAEAVLARRASFGQRARGRVVTPSRWLGERSQESPVFGGWEHLVIPYACDLGVFHPGGRDDARAELGLDTSKTWLMFIADNLVDRRKGFDIVVDAFMSIEDAEARFGLLAVGSASEAVEALDIEVRPLGAISDERNVARAYAAADALLLPSRADNLPNTMVEALCCGTPVIGAAVGGIPDCVEDGVNGHLVDVNDPKSLQRVLQTISPEALAAMRAACRSRAEQTFEPRRHAEAWLDFAASAPVCEGFTPEDDGPLLRAAHTLADARVPVISRADQPAASGSERLVRVTLERQLRDMSVRLRESERDRADRLAHMNGLAEEIVELRRALTAFATKEHGETKLEAGVAQLANRVGRVDDVVRRHLSTVGDRLGNAAARDLEFRQSVEAKLGGFEERIAASNVASERRLLDASGLVREDVRSIAAALEGEHVDLAQRVEALERSLRDVTVERDILRDRARRSPLGRIRAVAKRFFGRPSVPASEGGAS